MKLTRLEIDNVLAVQNLAVDLDTPITILAGRNAAGKTSTADAIRMALAGELPRGVRTKEQQLAIVHDGAKAGAVAVSTDAGDFHAAFPVAKGAVHLDVEEHPALPFVLAPQRFAALDPAARRTLLFRVTGCGATPKDVRAKLLERELDEKLVDEVLPLVRSGFPTAEDHAKAQARDAKTAWKTTTGEAYGEKKAEGWAAPVPPVDEVALAAIDKKLPDLEQRISLHTQSLGKLREQQRQYDADVQARGQRAAVAARLPDLQAKLANDEKELAKWQQEVENLQQRAGAAPRVGLVHELADALLGWEALVGSTTGVVNADGVITPWDQLTTPNAGVAALLPYIQEHGAPGQAGDEKAAARLPAAIEALDLCTRTVTNDKRDIAAAEAAAEGNKAAGPERITPEDVSQVQQVLQRLKDDQTELRAARDKILAAQQAAAQAAQRTQQAAQHHAAVLAWLAIADALSQAGIPAEILSAALEPFNARAASNAAAAGWPVPRVEADMSIVATRPYALLSASEQFRVDALLAEAIAHLSGLRMLVLDAFDILDIPARGQLLDWLEGLAADGELDTAVLLGTLKSLPGDSEHVRSHWIEAGALCQAEPALQAAA